MTQVNPPPFLVLDETDAALDEANSKRYADMILGLGAKSQLIVIKRATHALTPFGPRSFHEVHDGVFDNINIDSCRSQI